MSENAESPAAASDAPPTHCTVICHQEHLVAEGIARQVEQRLRIPSITCVTCDDFVDLVAQADPEVVACSIRLSSGERLMEIVERLREASDSVRLIALAPTAAEHGVREAWEAGVAGFASLELGPDHVVDVLSAVLRGERVLPPKPTPSPPRLTDRELRLLHCLERGLSYEQISWELNIAVSTAKTHSRMLFRKLGVTSRSAAVYTARREGLL